MLQNFSLLKKGCLVGEMPYLNFFPFKVMFLLILPNIRVIWQVLGGRCSDKIQSSLISISVGGARPQYCFYVFPPSPVTSSKIDQYGNCPTSSPTSFLQVYLFVTVGDPTHIDTSYSAKPLVYNRIQCWLGTLDKPGQIYNGMNPVLQ